MTTEDINDIIAENRRRNAAPTPPYNPATGEGCFGERVKASVAWEKEPQWLPATMVASPLYKQLASRSDYIKLRIAHDFEYWAVNCVHIHNKLQGGLIPFKLNAPQRRMLSIIETDRLAGRPLRIMLLKARQWGGSTLINMYFMWIQCVLKRSWNALICAQKSNTSAQIRHMSTRMFANYPEEFWFDEGKPGFKTFEGMPGMKTINGRDCQTTIASSFGPDSVRGLDYTLAHLSEVAFWQNSELLRADDFIRAIVGGIPLVPLSFVAIESTANGVGNYFHTEWLRAKEGRSSMRPIFVPWYEIDTYSMQLTSPAQFVASMDSYEWDLWRKGLRLEQIAWYHTKLLDMPSRTAMHAEYPTTDVEAFVATGSSVFGADHVEAMRRGCSGIVPARGDMAADGLQGAAAGENVRFVESQCGDMLVWHHPDPKPSVTNRYVVVVDIGGRTASADWSVIAVLDRGASPKPTIAAQWRGHCDHDILGWRAMMIARYYHDALLVFESNTLESAREGSSRYILEQISQVYPNLYAREVRDTSSPHLEHRLGFHTNTSTKPMVITGLIAAVREGAYIERSTDACNELTVYEQHPNGSYGAKAGFHDDILMTRAIALYVSGQLPPLVPGAADLTPLLHPRAWI